MGQLIWRYPYSGVTHSEDRAVMLVMQCDCDDATWWGVLDPVVHQDEEGIRRLYFGQGGATKSALDTIAPQRLVLAYARAALTALGAVPEPMRSLIIGLGGLKPIMRGFRISERDKTWQEVEYAVADE